ncbi:S24 family peptidase [Alloalcanivorax xenomutans]
MKDNLRYLMEKAKENPYSLASATGVPQPTIHRIVEGESKSPRDKSLRPLAEYFGVTLQDLRYEDLRARDARAVGNGEAHKESGFQEGAVYKLNNGFRKVPVVGRAELGPDGFWAEIEYPVGEGDGFIFWPTKDKNAYAVEAHGDSMAPRIKHKEFIIVEPNSDVLPGDEVLIKTREIPPRCMVKIFQYTRDDRHHLGNINNEYEDFKLDKALVDKMHFVAGIAKRRMHRHE